jgi:cell shape-determining protein MreC
MKLLKRAIELILVMLIITLFMMNKDVQMSINLFGLTESPVRVSFWVLVTICVALGILIAAIGDFVTQLQWHKERKRMIKTDKEHEKVVKELQDKVEALTRENERLSNELEDELSKKSGSVTPSGIDSDIPTYSSHHEEDENTGQYTDEPLEDKKENEEEIKT